MAYVSQEDKSKLAPKIRAVLSTYKMKGTISVRHNSTLVVTIKSGVIDFGGDIADVNIYWIHEHYKGVARKFLTELLNAMKGPDFYDHTDLASDYFNVSHYTDIRIGSWKQNYKLQDVEK
jgi:hypothetical protein